MHAIVLLCLILVPAPPRAKVEPPPSPWIGAQSINWGECRQTTFFYDDGTCWSPQFGAGTWVLVDDSVWFTEQGGRMQYVMQIDPFSREGTGWHVNDEGQTGNVVEVKIRRGERLPMPREVQ